MEGLPTVGLLLFLLVLVFVSWARQKKGKNLPPGPFPWPIFGNLSIYPMAGKDPKNFLSYLHAKYGDIVTVYLGARRMVLLNNYKLLKEAFLDNNKYTDHRPVDFVSVKELSGGRGLVNVNGPRQREIRKFAISAMRDFGVGKQSQEGKILDEVQFLSEEIVSNGKTPFDPEPLLTKAVSNIIGSIIFGERSAYADPHFKWFLHFLNKFFMKTHLITPENYLPWLRFLRRKIPMLEEKKELSCLLEKYIEDRVEEHKKSFNPDKIRDFVDLYIRETTGNSKTSLEAPDLSRMILELYTAGTETTVTTLRWVIIYLATYSEVQDKCINEIRGTISPDEKPKLSDRENLPYIGAFIKECMRLGNTAPATLLHQTTEDITLGGYYVPAGTLLEGNLIACHMDERVWSNPKEFRPERWLSPDGKLMNHPEFVPFSLGRRDCLGEKLAKTEIFLFTTCLLQKFRFRWPEGELPVGLEGVQRLTHGPKAFRVVAHSLNG